MSNSVEGKDIKNNLINTDFDKEIIMYSVAYELTMKLNWGVIINCNQIKIR